MATGEAFHPANNKPCCLLRKEVIFTFPPMIEKSTEKLNLRPPFSREKTTIYELDIAVPTASVLNITVVPPTRQQGYDRTYPP